LIVSSTRISSANTAKDLIKLINHREKISKNMHEDQLAKEKYYYEELLSRRALSDKDRAQAGKYYSGPESGFTYFSSEDNSLDFLREYESSDLSFMKQHEK
jgi:DNA-binding protein H-NS